MLNNLTTVNQGVQTRTFSYDSLSRLTQAVNPESGTINYSYDANGNLTTKIDARGVQTDYVYDALNRVMNRNYSLTGPTPPNYQASPNVSYFYDNLTNAKGKLTKVASAYSTTEYQAFDILGRVTQSQQTTDGTAYDPMTYIYNLSGALVEQTYPSGRVVQNTLDVNGDLAKVESKKDSNDILRPYAGSFIYTAAGAVASMRLGNGKFENTQFNNRLQPIQIGLGSSASTQNILKLNYDYGTTDNNGNVRSQVITVPTVGTTTGFVATQTYSYDPLNRIKDATEHIAGQTPPTWEQTFTYDRYGNRNFDEANTTQPASFANPDVTNPTISATNNRFASGQGYSYDLSGNTTADALDRTYVYDAENKQVEVLENSVSIGKYFYDGDGKRVKKISDNETVIFVYDAGGKLVAEYANQISQTPTISYLTNDHLGSPRITTDVLGQVISRRDFHPFGEEIYRPNYGSDSVRQKFTGYERDNETGLDFAQARYFNSGFGRFSSPDSVFNDSNVIDPQSWNLYQYVRNNPLNLADPTGKLIYLTVNGRKHLVTRGEDGNYTVEDNDLDDELLQEAIAALNRLSNLQTVGSAVNSLFSADTRHEFRIGGESGYGSSTEGAYWIDSNGTMHANTHSGLAIAGGGAEELVQFAKEIIYANDLREHSDPYYETGQRDLPKAAPDWVADEVNQPMMLAPEFRRLRAEQNARDALGLGTTPLPTVSKYDDLRMYQGIGPDPDGRPPSNTGTGSQPPVDRPKPRKLSLPPRPRGRP